MTVKIIPPASGNEAKIAKATAQIVDAISPHIKKGKLDEAVRAIMIIVKPLLNLQGPPEKGVTVMTEGASRNEFGNILKKPSVQ